MQFVVMAAWILFTPTLQDQSIVFSGSFQRESRWTTFEGDWQIVPKGSGHLLLFADNFEAKRAPDLKVFLSKLPFEDVDSGNAAEENHAVLLAPLTKYEGAVEIDIPGDINPAAYRSLIVHCEKYAKLWGGSPLRN